MDSKDFCHLHIHNEFSQLDGFGTAKMYAEKAVKLGFKYIALTNHGNIDGLIKFQKACVDAGVTPILGCEGYVVPDIEKKSRKRGHILLLIKNQTGFENLCTLLTHANLEGFYYKPRISYDMLLKHCKGLVISTACAISFVRAHRRKGHQLFYDLHDTIKDDLYCEIMPHDMAFQHKANQEILKLAKSTGTKVIATNDCHYVNKTEWKAQEVLLAIQRKAKWDDPNRWSFGFKGLHLKSVREMSQALKKVGLYKKSFLTNTIEIAEKCAGYQIPKAEVELPKIPGVPKNEEKFLKRLCKKGFQQRFDKSISREPTYNRRLREEYNLITKQKFTRYFLLVWELVNWCRKNDILVGPGRGSVGGSLIAYLLGITSVDPIYHGLLFSRFISEDRIDYPDIDIDFEDTKRHLVREHLAELYGKENIAGISSFQRMKSRAVIKDVGRVFDVPYGETNEFTKLIDFNAEDGIQQAVETSEEGYDYYKRHKKVVRIAKKLEGQVRGYSQHAAGLVLAKDNIGYSGKCNLLKREGNYLVNWEKGDTEYVGLLKLDALGLKLMSILAECKRLIKENHGKDIDFDKISLHDRKVYKEISKGNTVGLFQLNTWATTTLIKDMGVEEFDHIAAVTALVRPGPANSGMTGEFIRRKHGGRWERRHDEYENMLADTYGLIIYQEQVMETISHVGGLPYSTADKIRKIIGKKRDPKEFKKYKKKFIRGAVKVGIFDEGEAVEFWHNLENWAQYGFNKSHSVEYGLLGYWCGWLKLHFPTEFICASLTHGAEVKKKELVEEAYRLGLTLVLPKVGISNATTWVAKKKKLYVPFIEVKGIGKVKAHEATVTPKSKSLKKFYNKSDSTGSKIHNGKLGVQLKEIGAYEPEEKNLQVTDNVKSLFDFRIVSNPKDNYQKLYDLFDGHIRLDRLDDLLKGEPKLLKALAKKKRVIKKRGFKGHEKLTACTACSLRSECDSPVHPSPGRFNIMVAGEAPGFNEDKEGEGFVGKSGNKLWTYLKRSGLERYMFHITNIAKCFPSRSRKPNSEQIRMCGQLYFKQEVKRTKPLVILAFGNTCLEYFTGQKSGIINMSGQVQWSEGIGAWIVWCLHPAAVLHNADNQVYFKAGMKSFIRTVRALGLKPKRKE